MTELPKASINIYLQTMLSEQHYIVEIISSIYLQYKAKTLPNRTIVSTVDLITTDPNEKGYLISNAAYVPILLTSRLNNNILSKFRMLFYAITLSNSNSFAILDAIQVFTQMVINPSELNNNNALEILNTAYHKFILDMNKKK